MRSDDYDMGFKAALSGKTFEPRFADWYPEEYNRGFQDGVAQRSFRENLSSIKRQQKRLDRDQQ